MLQSYLGATNTVDMLRLPTYLWIAILLVISLDVRAQGGGKNQMPAELNEAGINPNLGAQLSLDLPFKDEQGREVTLRNYVDGTKPVVIVMAYYACPMLCGVMMNAARETFEAFRWRMGERYSVVTISIDPREKPDLAKAKKDNILEAWAGSVEGKVAAGAHWHFLTGPETSSATIAKELGFGYKFIEEDKQYAHSAGLFFVSPQGKLSRVLGGISYTPQDLKFALLEAGEGKIGTIAEKIMLFCYSYDPKANKYALLATRVMKAGGGLTVAVIGLTYLTMFIRSRTRRREGTT